MHALKKYGPFGLLLICITAAYASGLLDWFTLARVQNLQANIQEIQAVYPWSVRLGFVVTYAVIAALSLPIATLITLLGGALFGPWMGTVWVVLGATLGATLVFALARSAFGDVLRRKATRFQKKVEKELSQNAFSYLLFLRLVPVFPFFVVNILPALFPIPLRTYVLTTFIGIIPGTFVYVNLGANLASLTSLTDLISGKMLLAFTLLGCIALVPVVYRKLKGETGGKV